MRVLRVAKLQMKWAKESEKKRTKNIDPMADRMPLKIDAKTVVFVKKNITDKEKEEIIKRYSKIN